MVLLLLLTACGATRTVVEVPGPTRTVTATATATRTVPGPERTVYRTYYVDCFQAQCTSLPGAGPFGTTCGPISTGEQLCQ